MQYARNFEIPFLYAILLTSPRERVFRVTFLAFPCFKTPENDLYVVLLYIRVHYIRVFIIFVLKLSHEKTDIIFPIVFNTNYR